MATYFVRTDGNNSNTGTSSGTGGAWATVAHALGGTGTASGVTGGDTIYIAPGKYAGLTIAVAPSSMLYVIGDPSGAQFGYTIPAGPVHISNISDRGTAGNFSSAIIATSKDYISLKYLVLGGIQTTACHNWMIDSCHAYIFSNTSNSVSMTFSAGVNANTTVQNCTFYCGQFNLYAAGFTFNNHTSTYTSTFRLNNINMISNISNNDISITCNNATDIVMSNIYSLRPVNVTGTVANQAKIINSILGSITGSSGGNFIEDYNVFVYRLGASRTNVATGANSVSIQAPLIYGDVMAQSGALSQSTYQPASQVFNQLIGYGTTTDAPTSDYFGNNFGTPMTIGIAKSATLTGAGVYSATERNASTITIAPGSTSQSIELYLGATGLTASTSGLSAYYNRTRSTDVQIPLVARTIGEAWTSGGFAEVNASTMPGVYRLDLPDAAVAAGADDVTVVVRGASGTNGAVMTVKLSSGGLTAAQTAQAVLDAVASTHNNIGSIGAFIQDKTGYSLSTSQTFSTTGSVGSVTGNVTGNVTGTVGGVVGNIVGNLTGSVGTVATPDNIIDGVWDEQRVGHTASGSFGEKLQTNAMADEILARDLGSGLNAGTAEERTVRSALRALRNKVNVGSSQMVVKKEDDTTDAWTASVTTTAVSSNVSGIDPN
jgi:hypothetical protein